MDALKYISVQCILCEVMLVQLFSYALYIDLVAFDDLKKGNEVPDCKWLRLLASVEVIGRVLLFLISELTSISKYLFECVNQYVDRKGVTDSEIINQA